ncbi:HD domain-containing phosphohydrolase [Halomonas chromatireducens]|uniref:Cyclic di-GMP phosphodiesterase response regulator RpfG n=1 Tax=Halomonas chromatireducens TaxID=507626 RepID=A0A0X8HFR9_9GAMM|nr:HD domain-containing phosphohydrolase [Halomonas chromatireducens]AMD01831.1 Cyclic di-GMP phosphodiesterase response regulator RpfG [Halomonas chromatireducens]
MAKALDDFVRVGSPAEIELLLESMIQPGGASLLLDKPESTPLPVVLMEQVPAESLIVDITAVREIGGELKRGVGFRLLGQAHGKIVRTPLLKVVDSETVAGRVVCHCEYPLYLEEMQRREAFRARLRLGMEVGAILRGDGEGEATVQGDLKDLSQQGCQLELPASAASLLSATPMIEIELCFPNGTRFAIKARACHTVADSDRQTIRVGFRFEDCKADQERKLWFFVREIERESSRHAEEADVGRLPSMLFQSQAAASAPVGRRNLLSYPTPMARRLARVAGYLDGQLLELQQGGRIDAVQLSRHADMLLMLADEDMESLLFATRCLSREPLLVRHGLSVAAHILALADGTKIQRDVRKALAASAMVHDLGKGMIPGHLLSATSLDEGGYAQLKMHVALLGKAMDGCQWLSAGVVKAVVGGINERLDGSGYPAGHDGDHLQELSRMSAVVDVVDAMRRDRPDRPAWRIDAVYRHLLSSPGQFDPRWVKRYIQHFGLRPIGSLVRFGNGDMAWIQRLDQQGKPFQVQLTEAIEPPGEALGEVLRGNVVARLGEPVEEIPVST